MYEFNRVLSTANINEKIAEYLRSIEGIEISGKGLSLVETLKRGTSNAGPYPNVALFEAANRIATDLVILYGVKLMLDRQFFPFESYAVEYGNEDENGFDIRASQTGLTLVGEAFNVAPSFFQTKKSKALKKLAGANADFKLLLFNCDAVGKNYVPQPKEGLRYLLVDWVGTRAELPS